MWGTLVGSVVDPERFIPDPDPTSENLRDPDHTGPVPILQSFSNKNFGTQSAFLMHETKKFVIF
jgi:hypothetical protein